MLKSIRKEILVSLLSSAVFVIFLNPLFEFTWKFLNKFYSFAIDKIYETAALGHRNWLDFTVFVMLNLFIAVILAMVFLIAFMESKDENFSIINSLKEEQKSEKLIQDDIEAKPQESKSSKYYHIYIFTAIPFLYLLMLAVIFKAYADLQLNTSFNQRMNVIAPYIEEVEEEKLRAKWAQMASRKDFLLIDSSIVKIAKDNKVTLPPKLLN